MKYQGKSMMNLNEMAELAIKYEGDGYVTGYPIVSGNDAYILNGVIEANEEYITINQWVPVFPESLKPISPSLTDDQQVVLEWFKNEKKDQPFATVADFVSAYFEGAESEVPLNTMVAFEYLTNKEQFQVLAAFAEWGLNSCQNGNS
ncbi:hypothetical protein P7G51_06155 [Enterococcus asini]|uniref:hypothetical protein n=1 Tax=Enterococcus asini TaxID=57732 RepID=UPI00288C9E9B|nr:hypothetical protein [Enterococcus asini]MDT2756959.1 hypothetical protein [Enterococcus asini]